MNRKLLSLFVMAVFALPVFAQGRPDGMKQTESQPTGHLGGIEGSLISRNGGVPVADAMIVLYQGAEPVLKG